MLAALFDEMMKWGFPTAIFIFLASCHILGKWVDPDEQPRDANLSVDLIRDASDSEAPVYGIG